MSAQPSQSTPAHSRQRSPAAVVERIAESWPHELLPQLRIAASDG
ncbi:hypothetical protein [Saccharopolyspora sp. NPDC002376]